MEQASTYRLNLGQKIYLIIKAIMDFFVALVDELLHFCQNVRHFSATLTATYVWNDAVGAKVVATVEE